MQLNQFQQIVRIDDVPDHKLRVVLGQLLDFLHLEIIEESTPDYTTYEIRPTSGDTNGR